MAISTTVVARQYFDVTAGTPVAVNFPLYDQTEIVVYYGNAGVPATLNTDYTVTLGGDFSTFHIVPTAALITKIDALIAADDTEQNTVIVRLAMKQTTEATPASARFTEFTSREFERITLRVQQLEDMAKRVVKLTDASVAPYGDLVLRTLPEDVSDEPVLVFKPSGGIGAGPNAEAIAGAQANAEHTALDRAAAQLAADQSAANVVAAAAYDPTLRYTSIPLLKASTRAAAGVGAEWTADGQLYVELAAGATEYDVITAAEVKLDRREDVRSAWVIRDQEIDTSGISDTHNQLQRAFDKATLKDQRVYLPQGIMRCDYQLDTWSEMGLHGYSADTTRIALYGSAAKLTYGNATEISDLELWGYEGAEFGLVNRRFAMNRVFSRRMRIQGFAEAGLGLGLPNGGVSGGYDLNNSLFEEFQIKECKHAIRTSRCMNNSLRKILIATPAGVAGPDWRAIYVIGNPDSNYQTRNLEVALMIAERAQGCEHTIEIENGDNITFNECEINLSTTVASGGIAGILLHDGAINLNNPSFGGDWSLGPAIRVLGGSARVNGRRRITGRSGRPERELFQGNVQIDGRDEIPLFSARMGSDPGTSFTTSGSASRSYNAATKALDISFSGNGSIFMRQLAAGTGFILPAGVFIKGHIVISDLVGTLNLSAGTTGGERTIIALANGLNPFTYMCQGDETYSLKIVGGAGESCSIRYVNAETLL